MYWNYNSYYYPIVYKEQVTNSNDVVNQRKLETFNVKTQKKYD